MHNAYITGGEGVVIINLSPIILSLGEGVSDEYALRKSFLDQLSYFSDKKTSGEVIGVVDGNSARATLFDDGTVLVYFWNTKKRMTVNWKRASTHQ